MSQFGNDHRPDADPGREWSDAELYELGDMLVRGLSIEEIAHCLRRDHGDVRDKVAEVSRACRGNADSQEEATPSPTRSSAGRA